MPLRDNAENFSFKLQQALFFCFFNIAAAFFNQVIPWGPLIFTANEEEALEVAERGKVGQCRGTTYGGQVFCNAGRGNLNIAAG